MKSLRPFLLWVAAALTVATARSADASWWREWTVDGVRREALVRVPARKAAVPAPVVFVFHGHGGTMGSAAVMQPVHQIWPAAIVVYMQGLPTPGRLTDPEGKKAGWQRAAGTQDDSDLKFFDAVLASLRAAGGVDERRIYATGHSNGGGFTYVLWAARREVFAAFGPSAATAGPNPASLSPAPVIHVAGRNDDLVKFEWQRRTIDALIGLNQCDPKGRGAWNGRRLHASKIGTPVMTYIHDGDHRYPSEATAFIVDFFKAHARP